MVYPNIHGVSFLNPGFTDHMTRLFASIPNFITACRIALVPVLLVFALSNRPVGFLWVLVLCFASDAADGFFARYLGHTSELGARLDSWADFGVYLAIPIAAWWLWPETLWREVLYFGVVITSVIVSPAIAILKFHSSPSYHTRGAKIAAFSIGVSLMLLFGLNIAWPFRLATVITVIAALEEISITLVLPERRSNVRSLWHVWHSQRDNMPLE